MTVAALARRSERRTERLLDDLLTSQGWDDRKPPRGNLYLQHEYRDHPDLAEALAKASKSGAGRGVPEAILVNPSDHAPLAVIEAKAAPDAIDQAVSEAQGYGDAQVSTPSSLAPHEEASAKTSF